MNTRFRPRIGNARINAGTDRYVEEDTRSARAAMQSIISEYERFIKHVGEISPDILMEALTPAFELSKVYCPVDTGALLGSAYLNATTFRGIPTVEIGYAKGGKPVYAAAVHENTDFAHTLPTRSKFLEVALKEKDLEMKNIIVKRLKEVTGD